MNLKSINVRTIGLVFASTLLIPANYGLDIFGLNFEDLPVTLLFLVLLYKKIINYKSISSTDKLFLSFVIFFVLYSNIFTKNFQLLNQTNMRFYFYFILSYLCVDIFIQNNESLVTFFEPLSFVMIANFLVVIFQLQLPGTIDGWILNNSGSNNPLTSGRLGGFQGGGPNVIGIFCSIYILMSLYKAFSSVNIFNYFINNKPNTILIIISCFNLYITYSRGSYLALLVGLLVLLIFTRSLTKKIKAYIFILLSIFSGVMIFVFPSILLKQSNRSFLNGLALNNIEVIEGTGGGNYIKEVYKDFLLGLDESEILEKFNITYSKEDRNVKEPKAPEVTSQPVEGYLKLKFDYKDGILPRSIVSFYYSQNGKSWTQIGSDHTNGTVIELIKNNSFFEVGGWADGQSPGDSYLAGYINKVNINYFDHDYEYELNEDNRDKDYFIYLPTSTKYYDNRNDGKIIYTDDGIKLKKPRSYWIAIPNEKNISSQDFEIELKLKLESIPKGNETLFSQSSILSSSQLINNQSWKWSILDGKMYFFWVEDVNSGYSNYLGGMSLRSEKLISDDGQFRSITSEFTLSQYDEITTSHNGFLTMAVEYGLIPVTLIIISLFYLILKNFSHKNHFEISIMLALVTQNLTNDLIYSPDVAIYFWIIPSYFLIETRKLKN